MTTLKVHMIAFAGAALVLLSAGYFGVVIYLQSREQKKKLDKWQREQEWEETIDSNHPELDVSEG